MKKYLVFCALALAACDAPQGQGFSPYAINGGSYLNGGSGDFLGNYDLRDDAGNGLPGIGALPAGYIAGQEKIVNGKVVSSRVAVVPGVAQVASVASSEKNATNAMTRYRSASKQKIDIAGVRYRLAHISEGGVTYAVLGTNSLFGLSRKKVLAGARPYLKCPEAGGIWVGSGALAQRYAIPLNC